MLVVESYLRNVLEGDRCKINWLIKTCHITNIRKCAYGVFISRNDSTIVGMIIS